MASRARAWSASGIQRSRRSWPSASSAEIPATMAALRLKRAIRPSASTATTMTSVSSTTARYRRSSSSRSRSRRTLRSAWRTVVTSSSGRNDLRIIAYAPERRAPSAASMLPNPVMSTTSLPGDAARNGAIRSTPLPSGSFTSTSATSNPSRDARSSASAPRSATAICSGSSGYGCAARRTSRSEPARSALSSTMSTRPGSGTSPPCGLSDPEVTAGRGPS